MTTTMALIRDSLRVDDHPALRAAADRGPTLAVYLPDSDGPGVHASDWWTSVAVDDLASTLEDIGVTLWALSNPTAKAIAAITERLEIDHIELIEGRTPDQRALDQAIGNALKASIEFTLHHPDTLFPYGSGDKDNGEPRKVFSAFYKHCNKTRDVIDPIAAPKRITPLDVSESTLYDAGLTKASGLNLAPDHPWADKIAKHWDATLDGAHNAANTFLDEGLSSYKDTRNDLRPIGSSVLSPYLRSGQISVRRLWDRTFDHGKGKGPDHFRSELGWREFSIHMLDAFPHSLERPINEKFERFPWRDNDDALKRWKKGQTGYPVVDAAMRELWETGWMPNRARMIVASFLTKHLLIHWKRGADWFMHTLVDADLANNTMGWQWTAGSGFDAAPYFRIFNPISQGDTHDPDGLYVREWVPELAERSDKDIHEPLESNLLNDHGYPPPIVEHSEARNKALDAYESIKEAASAS